MTPKIPSPYAAPNFGVCVRCGAQTQHRAWGEWVCEACCQIRSSCCPEFGPDDLTDRERAPDPQGDASSESPSN